LSKTQSRWRLVNDLSTAGKTRAAGGLGQPDKPSELSTNQIYVGLAIAGGIGFTPYTGMHLTRTQLGI